MQAGRALSNRSFALCLGVPLIALVAHEQPSEVETLAPTQGRHVTSSQRWTPMVSRTRMVHRTLALSRRSQLRKPALICPTPSRRRPYGIAQTPPSQTQHQSQMVGGIAAIITEAVGGAVACHTGTRSWCLGPDVAQHDVITHPPM